jgi:small multidrug resistance family-3 protein
MRASSLDREWQLWIGQSAWLLTLHPTAAGRVYAAYGGVYVAVAILWLWLIDGNRPTSWDLIGAAIAIVGMAIIMLGPQVS